MKKNKIILLVILIMIMFNISIEVKADPKTDANFYKNIEKVQKDKNKQLLCIYKDEKGQFEEERQSIAYLATFTDGYYSNYALKKGLKTMDALYPTQQFGLTHAETIAQDYKFYNNLKSCPDQLYYLCFYDGELAETKYLSKNNDCFVNYRPIDISDVKKSMVYIPKKTFSGVWKLNKNPILGKEELEAITFYSKLNRTDKAYVNALDNNNIDIEVKKNNIKMNISNIEKYKTIFQNKEESKYPKYLIKRTKSLSYEFINSLKDSKGNKIEYEDFYVNVLYLNSIYGLDDRKAYQYCEDLLGGKDSDLMSFLKTYVFKIIWISIPIILILLTSIDFSKVIFGNDKDDMKNAFRKFTKRAFISILIFLTPTILILISNLIGINSNIDDCIKTINGMTETNTTDKNDSESDNKYNETDLANNNTRKSIVKFF